MNNQTKKSEKLEPQDSEQKNIVTPNTDIEAVVKPEDQTYTKEDANLPDPAKRRETDEQPVNSVKTPPKD